MGAVRTNCASGPMSKQYMGLTPAGLAFLGTSHRRKMRHPPRRSWTRPGHSSRVLSTRPSPAVVPAISLSTST